MNPNIYDCKGAADFLGIKGKRPERAIQKMALKGVIRGVLLSKKHGYRFHQKALEDALILGGKKQ